MATWCALSVIATAARTVNTRTPASNTPPQADRTPSARKRRPQCGRYLQRSFQTERFISGEANSHLHGHAVAPPGDSRGRCEGHGEDSKVNDRGAILVLPTTTAGQLGPVA